MDAANLLVQAVRPSEPDTTKAFSTTFNAIAGARQDAIKNRIRLAELVNKNELAEQRLNFQNEMLPVKQQLMMAQAEAARTRANYLPAEADARIRKMEADTQESLGKLQRSNAEQEQLTKLHGKFNTTLDSNGRPLISRLMDPDPAIKDAAANEAYGIVSEFGNDEYISPKVQKAIQQYMVDYPILRDKQQLAVQREDDRRARSDAKTAGEEVQRKINQQNADANTLRANTTASKAAPMDGELMITVPNVGRMKLDAIRRTLARGWDPKASDKEKQDTAALKAGLLAIPSGKRDENTGNPVPRFSNEDISGWAMEGERQMQQQPSGGVVPPPKASPPPATPAARQPAATPAPVRPGATPRPAGAKPSASDLLDQFGIPTGSTNDGGDVSGLASAATDAIPLSSLPDISSIPALTQIPGLFGAPAQMPGWGGLQGAS